MKILDEPDDVATDVPMDGDVVVTDMLTLNDRCDRCIQHAVVRVQMPSEYLLDLCKHDFEKNELALVAAGAKVLHDERDRLLAKPA